MKSVRFLTFATLLLLVAVRSQAVILPYIDDTVATGKLKDLSESVQVLYYGFNRGIDNGVSNPGSLNALPSQSDMVKSPNIVKNVVYYPWTDLMVVKNPNAPGKSIGFAYARKGGLLSATLRATADWKSLKEQLTSYADKLQDEGIDPKSLEVKPLPVRAGCYKATLVMNTGNEVAIGNEVPQANPRGSVGMSVAFNKNMADIVMVAMHTGAAVGWNYTYEAAMAIVPFQALITIDWKSVLKEMRKDFKLKTSVTNMAITNMTRKLVEKKIVKIDIEGGEDHQKTEAAVWDIAKILMARTFKANHPAIGNVPQIDPPAGNGGRSFLSMGDIPSSLGGGLGGFSLFNAGGVTGSLSMVTNDSLEEVTESISIVSSPYKFITFNAGIQIGGLCATHPEYFAYEGVNGSIHQGCSSTVLPDAMTDIQVTPPAISTTIATKVPAVADASKDGKVESTEVDEQTKTDLEGMFKAM